MIEQVINEILAAEKEAEQMIVDAQSKAAEISLKTGELLDVAAKKRNEDLKIKITKIAEDAENKGSQLREEIMAKVNQNAAEILDVAKSRYLDAADHVIAYIIGE